jgi:hypothetical protein
MLVKIFTGAVVVGLLGLACVLAFMTDGLLGVAIVLLVAGAAFWDIFVRS